MLENIAKCPYFQEEGHKIIPALAPPSYNLRKTFWIPPFTVRICPSSYSYWISSTSSSCWISIFVWCRICSANKSYKSEIIKNQQQPIYQLLEDKFNRQLEHQEMRKLDLNVRNSIKKKENSSWSSRNLNLRKKKKNKQKAPNHD